MKFRNSMSLVVCPFFTVGAQTALVAPCVKAAPACAEWLTLAGGPARALVYRTYPLGTRNETVTGAFILIHGADRNPGDYYRTAVAAGLLAGALERTIILAPRIASRGDTCHDSLSANEVSWTCNGNNSWRYGGSAVDNKDLTSFDFADAILRTLARKNVFPNLKVIVVAGHSAGGMFVTRYAMANQVHDQLGVAVSYVVANPSTYAYADGVRPTEAAFPASAAVTSSAYLAPVPTEPRQPFLPLSDRDNCTTYDHWPFGLQHRVGYSARLSDDQLRRQLASRPTTYLLGELEFFPQASMDASCTAMAQGPTRLARGIAFNKYVNERLGARHAVVVVPLCGHNNRCMYTADVALPVIFPNP
jgi:pimeloyl-ACP methyl ester carboxylesterase